MLSCTIIVRRRGELLQEYGPSFLYWRSEPTSVYREGEYLSLTPYGDFPHEVSATDT